MQWLGKLSSQQSALAAAILIQCSVTARGKMCVCVFYDTLRPLTYYVAKCRRFCRIIMALKETTGLYETLKAEWNKKNPNLNKCGDILTKLKVQCRMG